eukprot:TRINITY_DN1243_c0_g2_i2.p1 TRINITY_DN1243_c0_g2~~TRINITY_DN1243_c0_g2_i2.p1  ORF type:complete len:1190 (+),score=319.37 TRINITY_DN1243_c0_g2_i2:16-3585(+)
MSSDHDGYLMMEATQSALFRKSIAILRGQTASSSSAKKYKKRYFIKGDGRLSWYKNKDDGTCLGSLQIGDLVSIRSNSVHDPASYTADDNQRNIIEIATPKVTLRLVADNEYEAAEWSLAIARDPTVILPLSPALSSFTKDATNNKPNGIDPNETTDTNEEQGDADKNKGRKYFSLRTRKGHVSNSSLTTSPAPSMPPPNDPILRPHPPNSQRSPLLHTSSESQLTRVPHPLGSGPSMPSLTTRPELTSSDRRPPVLTRKMSASNGLPAPSTHPGQTTLHAERVAAIRSRPLPALPPTPQQGASSSNTSDALDPSASSSSSSTSTPVSVSISPPSVNQASPPSAVPASPPSHSRTFSDTTRPSSNISVQSIQEQRSKILKPGGVEKSDSSRDGTPPPPPVDDDDPPYAWARVEFEYSARGSNELTLHTGRLVCVVEQGDDGWWLGFNPESEGGGYGYFPGSFVELCGPDGTPQDTAEDRKMLLKRTMTAKALQRSAPSVSAETLRQDESKRAQIAKEILDTEKSYVNFLDIIIKNYLLPLNVWHAGNPNTTVSKDDIKTIFTNIELILPVNQELLKRLHSRMAEFKDGHNFGEVFLKMAPFLKIYTEYGNRYEQAQQTLMRCKADSAFMGMLDYLQGLAGTGNGLETLLIMPVQRIPRYNLLLAEIINHTTPDHEDYDNLVSALKKTKEVAGYINANIKKYQNTEKLFAFGPAFQSLVAPHRHLIRDGPLNAERKVPASSKPVSLHFFLFNDLMCISPIPVPKGRLPTQYPMQLVWVQEEIKWCPNDFLLTLPDVEYYIRGGGKEWARDVAQCVSERLASQDLTLNVTTPMTSELRFGRFEYPEGGAYEGWWVNGRPHGSGKLTQHGNTYEGEWAKGAKEGKGKMTFVAGEVYDGQWVDDKPYGEGVMTFPHGDVYTGAFLAGRMHGRGVLQYRDGAAYSGLWKEDAPNGNGCMVTKLSTKDGNWVNGKLNGKGTEVFNDGNRYEGMWSNGIIEGKGTFYYRNESVYEGNMKDGMRAGHGKLTDPLLGEVYEGEWSNDLKDGKGVLTCGDGGSYTGTWQRGKRHGTGVYTSPTEGIRHYGGEWADDMRHGKGTITMTNGDKFEGYFKRNQYHGNGVLTMASGTIIEGKWASGQLEGRCTMSNLPNTSTSDPMWSPPPSGPLVVVCKDLNSAYPDGRKLFLPPRLFSFNE